MAQDKDIRDLARSGRKIEAIKVYRERYHVGLREAKDAVEALEAGHPATAPTPRPPDSPADPAFWSTIDELLAAGNKIEAIRRYRERFGTGLKEAKDAIDQRQASNPRLQVKSGCFIATAAFGTPLAPEVRALRRFRDRALLPTRWGRAFTRSYRWSPPLADRIRRCPPACAMVRLALLPVVALCRRYRD